ncbi:MAG: substrate-binding domain-containing protein [Oscillospiraceae bacterium]
MPEDYSVIGFDDLEVSQYLTPGLTTVRQQISLKGQKAVELLLKHIEDPALTKQEEILPLQLVERESVRSTHLPVSFTPQGVKKRPASTLTRRYRPQERNSAKVLPVLYILSEKGEKINITGGTTMKKTRIFSLIALVLAMLMVFAACAPAATDTKTNDSEQTTPADAQQTDGTGKDG